MGSADVPELQLLSNGSYHVMVTCTGAGYSQCNDIAVTRWRPENPGDPLRLFCYLRDLESGQWWTSTAQPVTRQGSSFAHVFAPGRATLRSRCFDIETETTVAVVAEDHIEWRRIRITNRSPAPRKLEVTSYSEIVLGNLDADASHPAFEKLFVQTEVQVPSGAILCTPRARAPADPTPWMFHMLVPRSPNGALHAATGDGLSFETDRMRFIGRGRDTASPIALDAWAALSGSDGAVLDPVAAIRCRAKLAVDRTLVIDLGQRRWRKP